MNNIFEFLKGKNREEKVTLAKEMWPNMEEASINTSIYKLLNGQHKTIQIKWVRIICERFGMDPNRLFGYPWTKKVVIKKKRV